MSIPESKIKIATNSNFDKIKKVTINYKGGLMALKKIAKKTASAIDNTTKKGVKDIGKAVRKGIKETKKTIKKTF